MNIDQKYHHETDFITLPVAPARNVVLRTSPPIAEIYPMERLTKLVDAAADPVSNTSVRRPSVFFKIVGSGMDKYPFLRRLSRLR